MSKVTFLCMLCVGMIGSKINAKNLNDNEVLKEEAQEKAAIKNIEFIEIDYELEASTDLLRYLPNDFDPYKGMVIDAAEIEFNNIPEPICLGFNTADYLPKNFNPYKGQ